MELLEWLWDKLGAIWNIIEHIMIITYIPLLWGFWTAIKNGK